MKFPVRFFSLALIAVMLIGALPLVSLPGQAALGDMEYEDDQGIWEYVIKKSDSTPTWPIPPSINYVKITGYRGSGGVVEIPSWIGGLGVLEIGDWAFQYDPFLVVTLPSLLISIGEGAFYGCNAMQEVIVGDYLYAIEESAFYLCTELVKMNLPETLKFIGESAFAYCYSLGGLATITLPSSLISIGKSCFYKCTSLVNLIIMEGVNYIPENAFAECYNLTTVYIPGTATYVGQSAFYNCAGLVNVIIGNGTTEIKNNAFEKCSSLVRVRMSQTVQVIGSNAFAYCTSLGDIAFNTGVASIGKFCLAYSGVHTIYFQSLSVPAIGSSWLEGVSPAPTSHSFPWSSFTAGAYSGTTMVKDLANYTMSGEHLVRYFGASNAFTAPYYITGSTVLRYIDAYAFYGNVDLKTADLDGITNYYVINSYAFAFCTDLTTVWLRNVPSLIGEFVFYYCISLTTANLQTGGAVVEQDIEDGLFQYCFSLQSITIPSWATRIRSAAFYGCYALESVTFAGGATIIEFVAFAECHSLETITIPGGVATIGESAFYNDYSLRNLTISSGVTKIGSWAFQYCKALKYVVIPNTVTEIDDYAFEFCTSLISVDLGTGLTRLGYSVFHGCFELPTITLPASLTTLGDNWLNMTAGVFDQCVNLTSISVASGNVMFSSLNGVLFNLNKTMLIQCPAGKTGHYMTPISTEYIMPGAFYYCNKLTHVGINEGITNITYAMFASCDMLTTVGLPSTLIGIDDLAFQLCPSLVAVDIPDSVKRIGVNAFYFCVNLETVDIGSGVERIEELAFYSCTSLKTILIPDKVYLIGNYSFMYCLDLEEVRIGQGIAWIGVAAFMRCESLQHIYFYSLGVPTIDILWIEGTPITITGHAKPSSDFPNPGQRLSTNFTFFETLNYDAPTTLLMGFQISGEVPTPVVDTDTLTVNVMGAIWVLIFFAPIIILGFMYKTLGVIFGTAIMSVVIGLAEPSATPVLFIGIVVTTVYVLSMRGGAD